MRAEGTPARIKAGDVAARRESRANVQLRPGKVDEHQADGEGEPLEQARHARVVARQAGRAGGQEEGEEAAGGEEEGAVDVLQEG